MGASTMSDMLFEDGELPPHPTGLVADGIQAWNEAAAVAGWPQVTARTASRLKRMKASIQDAGGLASWRRILAECQQSPFLMGRTTPPFTLTFDWLTKPANLVKVLEGNYKDRRGAAVVKPENWREKQEREAREMLAKVYNK